MIRSLPLLLPFVLAACGGEKSAAVSQPDEVAAPKAVSTASASATARGRASAVEESNQLYEFDYSYPAEAGRIPALKAWLDADRDKLRAQLIADAKEGQAAAKEGAFEYHTYAAGRKWSKVTETPSFLSLSAELYEYTGGAHPNHGYDALLWDKRTARRLAPLDLFVSPAAFDDAIQPKFCDALDQERAKRRGEPVKRDSGQMFNECIKPSAQTVILGSSNGQTFDRIGVLVGPYAAGPYAEGDYEFTFPVTPKLLAAVKPEFRDAFAAK